MKVSEIIAGSTLKPIARGRNLDRIGWFAGYLVVIFRGRPTRYIYGPNAEAAEVDKVASNPYPDALWSKLVKKHGWKCHKVEV